MKTEVLYWFDAFGEFHDLEAEGIVPLWGSTGAHMPPVRVVRNTVGGSPGSTLQVVRADVRPYSQPVALIAHSEDQFREMMDRVARMFDPTNGPGILRFIRTDGTYRELTCICVAGLGLTESEGTRGPGWVETVLEFEADDPYWRDPVQSESWASTTTDDPTFPIFPLVLGSSSVMGSTSLTLDSDSLIFPIWTIYGPGTMVTLTHTATGLTLTWEGTLTAGDLLTIDTARETVKFLPSGGTAPENETNGYPGLTTFGFWAFRPGLNAFDLDVAGADANTVAVAEWREGHNGP